MDKLPLAGLRICDQWMRVIGYELRQHQYITCLDLNTNYFSPRGVRTLSKAIQNNVSLRSIYLPRYVYLNKLLDGKQKEALAASGQATTYLEGEVGKAKYDALLYRLTLARVMRTLSFLGVSADMFILEYLFGEDAYLCIPKFLRYRSPLH